MKTLTKKCTRCKLEKGFSFFSKDITRKDELHPHCKCCRNELQNKRRKIKLKTDLEYTGRVRVYDKKRYWDNVNGRRDKNFKRMRARTSEQNKNYFIKSVYGITLDEYNILLKKQNGVCVICSKEESRKSRYGGICKLHIDHDHKTGQIRGLLCHKCNTVLGYMEDNVDLLMKAIRYLQTN